MGRGKGFIADINQDDIQLSAQWFRPGRYKAPGMHLLSSLFYTGENSKVKKDIFAMASYSFLSTNFNNCVTITVY